MKRISFNRRQILRAIHAACLALIFAACAQQAEGAPTFNSSDFSVSGSTVTDKGVSDTTSAYFHDTGSGTYNVSIGGVSLGNTTNAGGTHDLLHFGSGSVTNSGTLNATASAIYISGSGSVTNNSAGIITAGTGSGVYIANAGTINNAGNITTTSGKYTTAILSGTITNSGYIHNLGTGSASYIYHSGTVNNTGTIKSDSGTAVIFDNPGTTTATVNNTGSGLIAGNTDGIDILGSGQVTNAINATISASYSAVYIKGAGTVNNAGRLISQDSFSGYGINITGVGNVTNTGSIYTSFHLGSTGIQIDSGTVTNTKTVSASYGVDGNLGISINNNGSVTNTGSIYADKNNNGSDNNIGIIIGGTGTVNNSGSISAYDSLGENKGIDLTSLTATGTVTNSGTIMVHDGAEGNLGVDIFNNGTVTNSGSISAYGNTVSNSSNYGIHIGGTGSAYNTGTIIAHTSSSYNIGIGIGENAHGNGFVNNSGSISAYGSSGFGNGGIVIYGNGTVINSGFIFAGSFSGADGAFNTGVDIEGAGTVINTASGFIGAGNGSTSNKGIYIGGQGMVTNSGYIGGEDYGVYLNGDNSLLTANGGFIGGGTDAIFLNGTNSAIYINGRSNIQGLMEGNNNSGNALNFKLVGVTPAQAHAFNIYVANNTNSGSYTFNWSNGSQTYSWDGFATTVGTAVSLENVVDPGLKDVATKIDNTNLPTGFDPFYVAASFDPEAALNTLTGREINNAIDAIGVNQATAVTSTLNSHLDTLSNSSGPGGFDTSNFHLSTASLLAFDNTNVQLDSLMHLTEGSSFGGTSRSTDAKDSKELEIAPVTEGPNWGAWASGTVTLADQSSSNVPGYRATTGSPTVGVDFKVTPQLRVGALVNYTTTGANFSDGSRLGAQAGLGGIYGTWKQDHWHVNGMIAGGYTSYDVSRSVFGATANSHPGGWEALTDWTGGYDFDLNRNLRFTPELGLTYTHLAVDSHTEGGAGPFNLAVGQQDIDSLRTHLGGVFSASFRTADVTFLPEVHAAWYHEFLDDSRGVNESLPGAPALGSFLVQTTGSDRDFALVGVGLNTAFTGDGLPMAVFLDYNAQVGQDNYIAHTIDGGLRVGF